MRLWFFQQLLAATALFVFFGACSKEAPKGNLPNGQIALTFDDASVDNWHQHLPFLDSLHIVATFYVSRYHTLTPSQKEKLFVMQQHGHEIGFHTTNHADLPKEVAKNGMAVVEEKEINADLRLMRADGFDPKNFAYPYGSNSKEINQCLLRKFKSVRALSNKQNYVKSLVKETGEWKVLYGANVDNNSRLQEDGIRNLMEKAKKQNDCLVLVAHQINNPSLPLQISRERILFLYRTAVEKNLEFVTVCKIAR